METIKHEKGSEFHVVLSGMKLPSHIENRIAADIQRVVSSALAGYPNPDDPSGGNDGPAGGRGPHGPGRLGAYVIIPFNGWLGLLAVNLKKDLVIDKPQIEQLETALQNGIQQQVRG
jgi:hypothetical protein